MFVADMYLNFTEVVPQPQRASFVAARTGI